MPLSTDILHYYQITQAIPGSIKWQYYVQINGCIYVRYVVAYPQQRQQMLIKSGNFRGECKMIASTVVKEIRRMLGEGRLSQRKIASKIGVSRGTVNAIAQGKHLVVLRQQQEGEGGFIPPTGMPTRCPECGGLVQMPCLLCYIRSRPRRHPRNGSTHS
jgi:hypothetical protein